MLIGIVPALGLGLVMLAAGARLLEGWAAPTPAERLVLAWALGGGLLGTLTLLVGLWRFDRWTLGVLEAGLLLIGFRPLLALLRSLRPGVWLRSSWSSWSWRLLVAGLVSFMLLDLLGAGFVVLDGDALRYHLAVPHHWLVEGRISPTPGIPFANFPLLVQLTYAHGLIWGGGAIPALQHLCWALMLALGVYSWTRRTWDEATGLLAALLLLSLTDVSSEATIPRVDLALALFGWGAAVCWLRWYCSPTTPDRQGWLLCAAALAGCAAAGKYTGLAVALATGGVLVGALRQRQHLRAVVLFGSVVAAIAAPWYLKSWLWTGNPVFPFGADLFGGNLPADLLAQIAAENSQYALIPRTPLNFLLSPILLTFNNGLFASGRIGPLWLAFAPLLVIYRPRPVWMTPLLAWSGLFLLGWFWTSPLVRFGLPVLALWAPLLAAVLISLLRGDQIHVRLSTGRWLRLVAGLALVGWLGFALASNIKNTRGRWLVALGLQDSLAVLAAQPVLDASYTLTDLDQAAAVAAPLIVFDTAGYYLERPVILAGDLGDQPGAELERQFAGQRCGLVALLLPDQVRGRLDAWVEPGVRQWMAAHATRVLYRRGSVALYQVDGCKQ